MTLRPIPSATEQPKQDQSIDLNAHREANHLVRKTLTAAFPVTHHASTTSAAFTAPRPSSLWRHTRESNQQLRDVLEEHAFDETLTRTAPKLDRWVEEVFDEHEPHRFQSEPT